MKEVQSQSNIELFIDHLSQTGWAILDSVEGDLLINTITKKQKKKKAVCDIYARWAKKEGVSPYFPDSWLQLISNSLPLIEEKEFNPRKPMGLNGNVLNTYQEFVPKNKPASLDIWNEYLDRMFPVMEERDNVLNYIAHILQKPWQRVKYTLTLIGEKGCGKSSLGDLLGELVTNQYKVVESPSQMTKMTETAITNSLVCIIDDYKKQIDNESIKQIITSNKRLVEEKYQSSEMRPSFARIIVFTNYLEPFSNVDKSERRHYAPSYITHKVDQHETIDWLSDVWGEYIENGGVEAIYNDLISRDISGFSAGKAPPSAIVDSWRINDQVLEYEDFFERNPVITAKECASKLCIGLQEAGSLLRNNGYKQFEKVCGRATPPDMRRVYSRLSKEDTVTHITQPRSRF